MPNPVAGAKRPHAVSNIPGIGDFAYDDNGNMLSGAGRTVTWTSFDMPLTISKGGVSSTFYYGADRERVKQVRSDNVTVWYAGAMEVEAGASAVTVKTYLPNGLGVEIERNGASKLYFQHRDRLGSVMALSDETGALSEQLAYDAWGKRRTQATPSTPDSIDGQIDNKGFTGHEMLDGLDLVHMNGRVYDPLIARFMSGDVIIQEPEHSQSYNRYTYVWNNPTNLTDPTGFQAQAPNSVERMLCEQAAGCQVVDGKIVYRDWLPKSTNETSTRAGAASKQSEKDGTSRSANTAPNGGVLTQLKDGYTGDNRSMMWSETTAERIGRYGRNVLDFGVAMLPGSSLPDVGAQLGEGNYVTAGVLLASELLGPLGKGGG